MKVFEPIPAEIESIAKTIVDSALKVHRALGPGLLESVYFNAPLIKDGIKRIVL